MSLEITGKVVRGKNRGTSFGYPTANLNIVDGQWPAQGIYAAWVEWQGKKFKGALSCGPAYTFGESNPSLEVFLLDFSGDLYGQTLKVRVVQKLREMEKFDCAEALASQIKKDCEKVSNILQDN